MEGFDKDMNIVVLTDDHLQEIIEKAVTKALKEYDKNNREWGVGLYESGEKEKMGVDHDGVGGVGIVFTEAMIKLCMGNGKFTEAEWEDDHYDCMDKLGIKWDEGGCYAYTGDTDDRNLYLLITGNTLQEILDNEAEFIEKVSDLGITITRADIKVIEDVHTW